MSFLLRSLLARGLARFLPGGWPAMILLSPRARRTGRSLWRRRRGAPRR